MRKLNAEGFNKALLVDIAAPDVTVKITIGTFRQAEGPMDIDTKARVEGVTNHCSHAHLLHESRKNSARRMIGRRSFWRGGCLSLANRQAQIPQERLQLIRVIYVAAGLHSHYRLI